MRKLVTAIVILSVLVMISCVIATYLSDYAPVTDEVAIEQLNGGDEAFVALQTHNMGKEIAQVVTAGLGVATVILCVIAIYKAYKNLK